MTDIEFGCLPTVIGSMPHTDPKAACAIVARYLKDIPAWPQLPRRTFREDMCAQFSEGFPGVVVNEPEKSIRIDRSQDLNKPLEKLYSAYLENKIDQYPVSLEYAAGLHNFLELTKLTVKAVKGQVTGPITWGTTITDGEKAIIYDETLGDAAAKMLRLKAAWQEKALRKISKNTIIFVDEPSMVSFGSVALLVSKEKVISLIDEVFGGISGLKGVHCCGNTDWSVILATKADIVSFDAYNYGQSLSLYPNEVKKFLDRKGAISWGIVPNNGEALAKESVASLKDRLEETMAPFTRKGIPFRQLFRQGLLTPSCGLAALATGEAAARALELLTELSKAMRKHHL